MVLIYLDISSPRVLYTLDFIFKQRELVFEVTNDLGDFERYGSQHKLAYSKSYQGKSTWIQRAGIMGEDKIRALSSQKVQVNEIEFLSFDGTADPIASIFYVLTRYEEFTAKKRDEHGRFRFQDSVLKGDWISSAMCDRWAEYVIRQFIPQWKLENKQTEIVPTFDIDNTFAYRLKEGMRMWTSIAKDVFHRNHARIRERKAVLLKMKTDPYDTFNTIKEIAQRFPHTKVFWLVGKWAKKDRNISIDHPDHRALIAEMNEVVEIGLHPSYASFLNIKTIQSEKENLERIVTEVSHSRQHFLRFQLPETFQGLLETGFKDEWSMGFAEHTGFRCGTARSFKWFDLSKNKQTDLTIHPFVYMDGTLNEYMKLTPELSKENIQSLYNEVHRYGGDFVFLWHNETIGDYGKWEGWSDVLNFTLKLNYEQK